MEPDVKSYICRYQSGGTEYSCRIDAASVEDAARIMNALQWGPGSGPIGMPRRHHPHVEAVANFAVAALRHIRHLMARDETGAREQPPIADRTARSG